jgi:hypothetical protein
LAFGFLPLPPPFFENFGFFSRGRMHWCVYV